MDAEPTVLQLSAVAQLIASHRMYIDLSVSIPYQKRLEKNEKPSAPYFDIMKGVARAAYELLDEVCGENIGWYWNNICYFDNVCSYEYSWITHPADVRTRSEEIPNLRRRADVDHANGRAPQIPSASDYVTTRPTLGDYSGGL